MAINGTNRSVTLAIRLIPPIMIRARKKAMMAPVMTCLMPKVAKTELDMLFICGKLPDPKDERTVATAKKPPIQ